MMTQKGKTIILHALEDYRDIQRRLLLPDSSWEDCRPNDLDFDSAEYEYRVKPLESATDRREATLATLKAQLDAGYSAWSAQELARWFADNYFKVGQITMGDMLVNKANNP